MTIQSPYTIVHQETVCVHELLASEIYQHRSKVEPRQVVTVRRKMLAWHAETFFSNTRKGQDVVKNPTLLGHIHVIAESETATLEMYQPKILTIQACNLKSSL